MPRIIYWFLRFSILNPICIRLIGAASRRKRDLSIRSIYVALLGIVLFVGLLGITATGRFSLRELAAGSASVFTFLAVMQLILICLFTPIFMSGAIAKEANPKTWDILLTTPMSPLQIVLGNLFGRLFFIISLSIAALPLMIVTQFFGGVPLETILLTQLVAICLALFIAAVAISMSVTRTAGRKAAVSFFVITIFVLAATFTADHSIRAPIGSGQAGEFTTFLTPLNPFLVLETLLHPSGYVIPTTSPLPQPFAWLALHPIAGWCWWTTIASFMLITLSSLNVRKLGQRESKIPWTQRLFQQRVMPEQSHAVSGNPIAWRERVTRHRNLGSLIARWGFASLSGLTFIILSTLYFTSSITPDYFRSAMVILVTGEILIVTFVAISLSASSIAKEREDGSLDLLLTTAMTPHTYLMGKVIGLVMHLLPIVVTPCVTMMAIGCFVIINPDLAIVPDQIVGNNTVLVPMALYLPALLTPLVFIPFIAFCLTLGLMWSIRSRGSISAIVTSMILVFIVAGGLGLCLGPAGQMSHAGSFFAALSPISNVFATFSSVKIIPSVIENGVQTANFSMGAASVLSGVVWTVVSIGLLKSISASFVVTVRRLAGQG